MHVRIDNRTALPDQQVENIITWSFDELDLQYRVNVLVRWSDWWHHSGRFHPMSRLIEANIPRHINGQMYHRGLRGGPPPINPSNWQESLVCILAHEATHLVQLHRGPKTPGYERTLRGGRRIFVRGRQFSEVEAEWAEYHLLERWREERES